MNSNDLIAIITKESRQLVGGLVEVLRTKPDTSHYHRLSEEELFARPLAVYQRLAEWLATGDVAAVQRYANDLGRLRCSEGIPLGQVVLALILTESHLWQYLRDVPGSSDEKLRRTVADFFQEVIYSTAHGYEAALAAAGSTGQKASVPEPRKPQTRLQESELEISRGGEVGETSG